MDIASDGNAPPSGYSWSSSSALEDAMSQLGTSNPGATAVAGMVVTITVRDAREQDTATVQPLRQLDGTNTATITHSRAYNAFGEVKQQTDSNGKVTDFTYNTMGKITQQQSPTVNWTDETGTVHTTDRPTQVNYYDISGRLVGVQDPNAYYANTNGNTRTLLAGTGYEGTDPLVAKEFHADSGNFTNGYDVYRDLRQTTNEIGKVESYSYDAMDRLLTQTHPQDSPNAALV